MSIARAATVHFKKIAFTDENGDAASMDTATLTLIYDVAGKKTEEAVTLTFSSPYWSGEWDSSVADAPQTVFGHLEGYRSSDGLRVVRDFILRLTSNKANDAHHD